MRVDSTDNVLQVNVPLGRVSLTWPVRVACVDTENEKTKDTKSLTSRQHKNRLKRPIKFQGASYLRPLRRRIQNISRQLAHKEEASSHFASATLGKNPIKRVTNKSQRFELHNKVKLGRWH